MRRVRLLEDAAQEAIEAAAWYEHERVGLGQEFVRALDTALDLLEEEIIPLIPMSGAGDRQRVKRIILKRFPYDIVVLERPDEVLIVAVAHHSRRPGYWRHRLRT